MLATFTPAVRVLLPMTGIVWAIFEVRQATQQRPEADEADRGSRPAIRIAAFVGVIGAVLGKRAIPSLDIGAPATVGWIGLVVMWCGISLRIWSFFTLGRYFTFTVQTSGDQPVISNGPYRVIRHPGYAGILLAIVGIGFIINNWFSLVVLTAAFTAGLVYRISIEERALAADLGGRYQTYAASRKRLVPFIW